MAVEVKNCCAHDQEGLVWDPQRDLFICKECGAQILDTELAEVLGVS